MTCDMFNGNDKDSFVMIFYALSNAAYHVSLHGPGAELGGGLFKHPLARRVRRRAGAPPPAPTPPSTTAGSYSTVDYRLLLLRLWLLELGLPVCMVS